MKKNLSNYRKQLYRLVAGLILAIFVSTALFQPVIGKEVDVTFGETKVENFFPNGIRFSVKIVVQHHAGRIDFYYRLGEDQWISYPVYCNKNTKDSVEYYSCVYYLDYEVMPPQLLISYKWRLLGSVDRYSTEKTMLYEKPGVNWNSLHEKELTIWWHDRPSGFAKQILITAETAIQEQESFYGMELEHPIQIVIQNSEDEFYEWREKISRSIGGEAFPRLGTTVQIVDLNMPESSIDQWLNEVVPHEISHLYFSQATATARELANPPSWLDEGMAGYNEINDHSEDWSIVRSAIQNETLIPLGELRGDFTGDDMKIRLEYAESTTAIIYLIETYNQEGLNKLFSAYQAGKSSDEAFLESFGRSVTDVEMDWKIWVAKQGNSSINNLKFLSYYFISLAMICSCLLVLIFIAIFLIVIFNKKFKAQSVEQSRGDGN